MQYQLRLVEESDAAFILKLRSDPLLSKYLSATSVRLEDQVDWIRRYKERERNGKEYYYVFTEGEHRLGLYRLYNINDVSFTIGSWLFDSANKNIKLPIITDLLMGDIGFLHLNKPVMLFDVRKNNKRVIRYHQLKTPLLYNEDEENYYYLLLSADWLASRLRIIRYLGITEEDYCHFNKNTNIYLPKQ